MSNKDICNWDVLPVTLTLQHVALIFNVSDVTIKHMLYRGDLKARKIGKKWVFDKEYVKNYIQGVA